MHIRKWYVMQQIVEAKDMSKAEQLFEKIALKMPNLKIRQFTPKQMQLWDQDFLIRPLAELETKYEKSPILKKAIGDLKNYFANKDYTKVVGTVRPDKKTKKRFVILNKDLIDKYPRAGRRMTIAHEAFHAKMPLPLSSSELGAHIYGGIKSKAGLFKKYGPLDMYAHYWQTRPIYATVEHAGIAGTAAVGHKVLKTKDKK